MATMLNLVKRAILRGFGPASTYLAGRTTKEAALGRSAIVSKFLPFLSGAGVSGASSLRLFRSLGFGVSTSRFYGLARSLANVAHIKGVTGDKRVSAEHYTPTTWHYPDRLTAKVKIYYRDTATGRFAVAYINVGIEEGETQDEIEARAMANIEGYWAAGRAQYFGEVFDVSVEEILERT